MSRRRQSYSSIRTYGCESEDSIRSDNLHASLSLSPSSSRKIGRPLVSRKVKSVPKKTTNRNLGIPKSNAAPRTGVRTSGVPEDVAVHFGNFYNLNGGTRNFANRKDSEINKSEFPARSEFTRQMVHKLESLVGTEHYARQVSTILDETVESPNFSVKPPPADNFVPYETSEPIGYPLWYKKPDWMPSWTGNYSTSLECNAKRLNEQTKEMQSGKCITISTNSGSQQFADVTDCENNDESSSESSDQSVSDAYTEQESDCEDVKVAIVVE